MDKYTDEAIALLQRLIATPSTSRDEKNAADIMQGYIESLGMKTWREANNVWTVSPWFDENKPTLLLTGLFPYLRTRIHGNRQGPAHLRHLWRNVLSALRQ